MICDYLKRRTDLGRIITIIEWILFLMISIELGCNRGVWIVLQRVYSSVRARARERRNASSE